MKHRRQTVHELLPLKVDFHQAIFALSEALNLVGVDARQHGERVAVMAVACAKYLGYPDDELAEIFHAGLLHDCGVSSTRLHSQLVREMDWNGSDGHCLVGESLLRDFEPLQHLAPIIRYHHTHWDQIHKTKVSEALQEKSNLIFLCDRVDVLIAQTVTKNILLNIEELRKTIASYSGTFFSPRIVEAFLAISGNDAFWLNLDPVNLVGHVNRMKQKVMVKEVATRGEIRKLANLFARIVDAKSPYTFEHSEGVARLSVFIAERMTLHPTRIFMVELAALLHDLGKLGVPDELLEKKEMLTPEEAVIMHRHSYDTYQILRQIDGFEEIAEWAAHHHETLTGEGYPFRKTEAELSTEAKIIMVADIFQALAQDRPYRKGMKLSEILQYLKVKGGAGHLDRHIVKIVHQNAEQCYVLASHPLHSSGNVRPI